MVVLECWGQFEDDLYVFEGVFWFVFYWFGNQMVGIQLVCGYNIDLKEIYYDFDLVLLYYYFVFYIWLWDVFGVDVVIYLGKYGNLEWLLGKVLVLFEVCYFEVVFGLVFNIYLFIVNDLGEGVQVKCWILVVIVDYLMLFLICVESYGVVEELEMLLDEYYLVSGVDFWWLKVLICDILDVVFWYGLDQDIGIILEMDEEICLVWFDVYLCDFKELQICDGLYILGESLDGDFLIDLFVVLVWVLCGLEVKDNSF